MARIVVPEKDGVSYGTGTLVDARGPFALVVTNWHVVRDAAGPIAVEFPDGFKSPAQVVKTDRDWDLAALSIHRPPAASPVPITPVAPQPGEWLTIAGFGHGAWRTAGGPCTQYLAPGLEFPHEMVELAAEARQGDSGGPIFNQRGELAGVLFGSGPGYTSGSFGGRVLKFLATVVPGGTPGSDEPPSGPMLAGQTAARGIEPYRAATSADSLPQATALHEQKPAAAPIEVASDRPAHADGLTNGGDAALTPAGPRGVQLLDPPETTTDIAVRFGPLAEHGGVDPRVAVAPDPLATKAAAIAPPAGEPRAIAPVSLDTSLPPRAASPAAVLNRAAPAELLAALWVQIAGTSFADQAKTALAMVGGLALLILFWRIGIQQEAEVQED